MEAFFAILITLARVVACFCVSVVLHELGHLVCGKLTGYRFQSFRILNLLWTRDERGKLKVTRCRGVAGILGQCLMVPCEDERDFKFKLYNLGGGLMNLMISAAAAVPFFMTDNAVAKNVLFAIAYTGLFIGLSSLIPRWEGLVPNDGANIQKASKPEAAKHGLYLMLKVNAEMSAGKRITDYDDDTFKTDLPGSDDIGNYFVAYTVMLRASQLEERGDYAQSYNELLRLDPSKLPAFYSGQLVLSLVYHELVLLGDEASVEKARERLWERERDASFKRLMKTKHPALLPYQAAVSAFADGDQGKARELITLARVCSPKLQNPGQEHSVSLMLDRIWEKLDKTV